VGGRGRDEERVGKRASLGKELRKEKDARRAMCIVEGGRKW
jgi:hypothetical protein